MANLARCGLLCWEIRAFTDGNVTPICILVEVQWQCPGCPSLLDRGFGDGQVGMPITHRRVLAQDALSIDKVAESSLKNATFITTPSTSADSRKMALDERMARYPALHREDRK